MDAGGVRRMMVLRRGRVFCCIIFYYCYLMLHVMKCALRVRVGGIEKEREKKTGDA